MIDIAFDEIPVHPPPDGLGLGLDCHQHKDQNELISHVDTWTNNF